MSVIYSCLFLSLEYILTVWMCVCLLDEIVTYFSPVSVVEFQIPAISHGFVCWFSRQSNIYLEYSDQMRFSEHWIILLERERERERERPGGGKWSTFLFIQSRAAEHTAYFLTLISTQMLPIYNWKVSHFIVERDYCELTFAYKK